MEKVWKQIQQKKREPKIFVTDQFLNNTILEEEDEDNFDIESKNMNLEEVEDQNT